MSDKPGSRVSAFSKDIQRIAEDFEDLAEDIAEDFTEESELVRDEMLGAEILATKEITEKIGILWELAERLNAIGAEQARMLFDDYNTTYKEFTEAPGLHNYSDLILNHWLRRLDHVAEGARSVANLVTRETNLLEDVVFGMWKPFFAVVNRDWGSRS